MLEIDVMKMVKTKMKEQKKTAADLSRDLNTHYANVAGMLKRPTLQVQRLIDLSGVLDFNFFRQIGEMLPYANPAINQDNSVFEQEIASLKEKLKIAQIENTILKETLKTFASAR